jgi:hopanoid-associated phosphorylase
VIGIVTGFRAEARCLPARFGPVVCSGAKPGRARHLAEELVKGGASLLVSFGVAGGLEPALASGDLVIPVAVLTPGGGRLACDASLRARLIEALTRSGRGPAFACLLASGEAIVATSDAKRTLFTRTGASAVDMESHAVAEAATAAAVPFVVVRAIADTADGSIPDLATRALRSDGTTDVGAVLRGLLADPRQLPALLKLGSQTRRALKTLAHAGRTLDLVEL